MKKTLKVAKEFQEVVKDEEYEEEQQESKKEVIIPLINKTVWNDKSESKPSATKPETFGLQIPQPKDLPILSQNKVPGIESLSSDRDKYKHDLDLRPEDNDPDVYKRVKIEDYGMAMLKGMGWTEGKPIGKNPNGLVEPICLLSRPSRLGLGAEVMPAELAKNDSRNSRKAESVPKKEDIIAAEPPKQEERKIFRVNDPIIVTDGSKKSKTGRITDVKQDRRGTIVTFKCSKTGEIYKVWDDQIEIHRPSWLRPHIKVVMLTNQRVKSKDYLNGDYYNQKCIVQDVTESRICIIKTMTGIVIDNVHQNHLETCIPKIGSQVMILGGDKSLVGHLGKLVECDWKKEIGVAQMDTTFDLVTVSFDDFSEYVDHF